MAKFPNLESIKFYTHNNFSENRLMANLERWSMPKQQGDKRGQILSFSQCIIQCENKKIMALICCLSLKFCNFTPEIQRNPREYFGFFNRHHDKSTVFNKFLFWIFLSKNIEAIWGSQECGLVTEISCKIAVFFIIHFNIFIFN